MQLEIITPESNLFSGEVVAVQLPGKDGLFQVLNNHAPIISALTKGTIKVDLPPGLYGCSSHATKVLHDWVSQYVVAYC